jgi:pimeloyl-ACP methyl ester carboxylesterase
VRAVVSISGPLPLHSVIDRRDAPALFFQGTADQTVSYESVFDTARAFARVDVPVVFERLEGAGHVPFARYRSRFTKHSAYFLYEHLGL